MTPTTHMPPTAEEVEPWVEAIVRLWDDPALYEEQSAKARAEAQRLASRPAQAALRRVLLQGSGPAPAWGDESFA